MLTPLRPLLIRFWGRWEAATREALLTQIRYRALLGGDYEEYRASRESENFFRAVVFSVVLLVVNLAGLLVSSTSLWSVDLVPVYDQRLRILYWSDVVLAVGALGTAVLVGLGSQPGDWKQTLYSRCVLLWIYAAGCAFTLNGQGFHNQILNLFFALVFVSGFLSIPPLFSLVSHLLLGTVFSALLRTVQPDPLLLGINSDNALTAVFCAFFLSRVVFHSDLQRFRQQKLLAQKTREVLRQTKLSRFLTLANERKLTPREIELARLLFLGKSNKEVAAETGVEVDTVKKHLSSVFRKCQVASRVELLLFFEVEDGLELPSSTKVE